MSYCVIRMFFDGRRRVIAKGLTLEQAQEHCNNLETSSRTCTTSKCKAYTRRHGAWFDGYDEEPCKGRRHPREIRHDSW